MIACLDVHYQDSAARGACILVEDWASAKPVAQITERFEDIEPYVPGQFYRRELPCLLTLLERAEAHHAGLDTVVVDGFVWLGSPSKPGLGGHLFRALDEKTPVLGVAKSWLPSAWPYAEVHRGKSKRPLFVSAAGLELETASAAVETMHGNYRTPTILKRVDRLSRGLSGS
jgi:deoxyribonuclease V